MMITITTRLLLLQFLMTTLAMLEKQPCQDIPRTGLSDEAQGLFIVPGPSVERTLGLYEERNIGQSVQTINIMYERMTTVTTHNTTEAIFERRHGWQLNARDGMVHLAGKEPVRIESLHARLHGHSRIYLDKITPRLKFSLTALAHTVRAFDLHPNHFSANSTK